MEHTHTSIQWQHITQRHLVKDYKWTYLLHSNTHTHGRADKRNQRRKKENKKISGEWFWSECENCNAFAAPLSVLNVKDVREYGFFSLVRSLVQRANWFLYLCCPTTSVTLVLSGSVSFSLCDFIAFLIELSHKLLALFEHRSHFLNAFHHVFLELFSYWQKITSTFH